MKTSMKLLTLLANGGVSAPAAPTITAPTDAGTVASLTPTVTVGAVSGATGYDFDVATDSGFTSIVSQVTDDADGSWVTGTLTNGTAYYLRARARNSGGVSAWSSTVTFTTVVFDFAEEFDAALDSGVWTVTDTGGNFTVSGGKLQYTTSVAGFNPQILGVANHVREAGRILIIKGTKINASGRTIMGWSTTAGAAVAHFEPGGNGPAYLRTTWGVSYDLLFVLLTSGFDLYTAASGSGNWKFVLPYRSGTTTPLKAHYYNLNTTAAREVDAIRIAKLGGNWATTDGFATLNVASPTNDTDYTGVANGVWRCTFTMPGSLSGNIGFRWRVQDANNYHQIYIDNAGNFVANKVVAGTPTAYSAAVSIAGGASAGQTVTLMIHTDGSAITFTKVISGSLTVLTSRTDTSFQSATGVRTDAATAAAIAELVATAITPTGVSQINPFLT